MQLAWTCARHIWQIIAAADLDNSAGQHRVAEQPFCCWHDAGPPTGATHAWV